MLSLRQCIDARGKRDEVLQNEAVVVAQILDQDVSVATGSLALFFDFRSQLIDHQSKTGMHFLAGRQRRDSRLQFLARGDAGQNVLNADETGVDILDSLKDLIFRHGSMLEESARFVRRPS
jgi:hypothetical protein